MAEGKYKETLCWDCKRSYKNMCSWAMNYEPVEGWIATQTHNKYTDSYLVKKCPLFDRDGYNGGSKRPPKGVKVG